MHRTHASKTVTRRQLLRSAGVAAAGLTLSGAVGEVLAGALATPRGIPPKPPSWRSRPDLRIPALTVTHREDGVSADPIFIAPYNAPERTGRRGDCRQRRPAAVGEPAGRQGDDELPRAELSRQPGADVVGGSIELGHGVGEYVIADTGYRTVRRVQAAPGCAATCTSSSSPRATPRC